MPASLDERVAVMQQATDQAMSTVEELAQLSNIAYEQCRVEAAKKMGVRVSVLDSEVEKLRPKAPAAEDGLFPTIQPWAETVVLADLLDNIVEAIHRHVILEKSSAIALALYVLLTYCVDELSICAQISIESPEKRCGKTTLLDLLTRLCYRAISAASISPAAVYRLIEAVHPTLLIDEAESLVRGNPEMGGILNSGYTRSTAVVIRTEEINGEWVPKLFSTFSAKIIAQIGKASDTQRDRSIVISMRRKMTDEKVERLRKWDYSDIARKAYSWALENKARVATMEPLTPECLNDREADCWEPLFAMADIAGGKWPEVARSAAKHLAGGEVDTDSIRIQLLADLRTIIQAERRIGWRTTELLEKLCDFEDHPWPTYGKGHPINARQLAGLLKPFGIKSKVEHKLEQKRGYMTDVFADVFLRYLPPDLSVMPLDSRENNDLGAKSSVRSDYHLTDKKPLKPLIHKESNGITHRKGGKERGGIQNDETNVTEDSWEF